MRFYLRPDQLVAHWVPGFLAIGIVCLAEWNWTKASMNELRAVIGAPSTVLAVVVAGFAIGQFLDGLRNLFEEAMCNFHQKCAIKWDFILKMSDRGLGRMEEYYFTYYLFDFNMAGSVLFSAIAVQLSPVVAVHRLST